MQHLMTHNIAGWRRLQVNWEKGASIREELHHLHAGLLVSSYCDGCGWTLVFQAGQV